MYGFFIFMIMAFASESSDLSPEERQGAPLTQVRQPSKKTESASESNSKRGQSKVDRKFGKRGSTHPIIRDLIPELANNIPI